MASSSGVGSTYMGTDYKEYLNSERVRKTELGKNDFLNLLAAQMQYQNPLEPMSDTDFIAQLAQFSALEQMEAMSTAMISMQAFNLVGKYVYATSVLCDDGVVRDIGGYVETVIHSNGNYYAKIGDYMVQTSKITEVYDKDSLNQDNPLVSASHLIGCTVSGYMVDEKGNLVYDESKPVLDDKGEPSLDKNGDPIYEAKSTTGVVTGIGVENNTVVAYVKTTDADGNTSDATVAVSTIFDIRQTGNASTSAEDLQALLESLLAGQNSTTGANAKTPPLGDDDEIPPPGDDNEIPPPGDDEEIPPPGGEDEETDI